MGDESLSEPVVILPIEGREVRILGARADSPMVVEWRSPTTEAVARELPNEASSALLAKREVHANADGLKLSVASRLRWLRFLRPEASPVTIPVSPNDEEPVLRLPEPTPGGEVFGTVGPAGIVPLAVLLDGSRSLEVRPDGTFGAQGVATGSHSLLPVYRGGFRGAAVRVVVTRGETTEVLPLPSADVAGFEYLLPLELCPAASPPDTHPATIAIDRLARRQGGEVEQAERIHELPLQDSPCAGAVEGLPPGEYSIAALDEKDLVVAHARVLLAPGELVGAALAAAAARVTGRVTIGEDEPFADALLEFSKESLRESTTTDALGRYEVSLPEPGRYRVALKASRFMPLEGFDREIHQGEQEIDFQVEGGVIDLGIRTLDGSEIEEPIQVELVPEQGSKTVGFVLPEEGFEHLFPGLDYGRYEIRAFSASGWSSEAPVEVRLTEDEPYQQAELLLRHTRYVLRLVGPTGRPVSGATVQVGMVLPEEREPGVFRLPTAAPGHRLEVRAEGFTPVCRLLRGQEAITLTLRPARGEALIVFPEGTAPHGSVAGLPGSDCPVREVLLGATVTRAAEGSALSLHGLPEGEFVFVQRGGGSVRFSVPGPAAVLLKDPQKDPGPPRP